MGKRESSEAQAKTDGLHRGAAPNCAAMNPTELPGFFLVSVIFFAAGVVKGVLGMGLPTLAMGLLGILMPVSQAAALLTVPSLVTNLWQACTGGALRALLVRAWTLQAGIVVGIAGAAGLPPPQDQFTRPLLGACLLAYGACGLAGWRPRQPSQGRQVILAPLVGVITGVVTALTGVFVLPAVPYLQSLQLDRRELAQALGLSFTTSTVALAGLLASRGQLGIAASVHSALVLVPALAGMVLGQTVRDAMSEAGFRRCFFWGLVLLGGWLLVG